MARVAKPALVTEAPELEETASPPAKPKIVPPTPEQDEVLSTPDAGLAIDQPDTSDPLAKFKRKHKPIMAGVKTLLTALDVHSISQAKDFVRLHHDDVYWSDPLAFVNVPGLQMHIIDEELATALVQPSDVKWFQLALAAMPNGKFFLCTVPTENLDNRWNADNVAACNQARTYWVRAVSRRSEGAEGFLPIYPEDLDAFPEPKWPSQTLNELILITFAGRIIETADHPGLARYRGKKPSLN